MTNDENHRSRSAGTVSTPSSRSGSPRYARLLPFSLYPSRKRRVPPSSMSPSHAVTAMQLRRIPPPRRSRTEQQQPRTASLVLGPASLGLGSTRVRSRVRVRVPPWMNRRCSRTSSDQIRLPWPSIAVSCRKTCDAVSPAAWTSPRSCSRRQPIAPLLPLVDCDCSEIGGSGGHTGGAHESTLVCASPVDRPVARLPFIDRM